MEGNGLPLSRFSSAGKKAAKAPAAAVEGERLLWLPGATAPAYLTGEFTGDRGFDPLGLAKDPKTFERNRVAEIFHGRLAMLGALGFVVPELQGKPAWFNAITASDPVLLSTFVLALIVFSSPLEIWRYNSGFGWEKQAGKDSSYPGFDPFGLFGEEAKLKEVKNGRLAMVAMLGFFVQAAVTGSGPIANAAAHYADPFGANITTAML